MTSICFDILTSQLVHYRYCGMDNSIPWDNLFAFYVILKLCLWYQEYGVFAFRLCRFTFPSFILVVMIFDTLAIGKNPTYTTSFSCIFICCVSSMCSLLYDASVQRNVVLQFCGFNKQSTQCISLLLPFRYLVTWLLMFSNCRPGHT